MIVDSAPWEVRRHVNGPMADIYSQNADRYFDCLATTAFHGWTVAEMEAHARLIAAAPAMYAALKLAYEFIVSTHPQDSVGSELKDRALDAVCNALARGES